jgi:hypothetical protein
MLRDKAYIKQIEMMNLKFYKILILFIFMCNASFSFAQLRTLSCKTSITVLNSIYKSYEADLILKLNGDIVCTGGCSPQPLLGLLMKNNKNGWDTLVDINKLGQLLCGPGHKMWHNDTIGQQLFFEVPYIGVLKKLNNTSGVFKLTFLKYKKRGSKLECSNEFEIKKTTPENKSPQALTAYYDTTAMGFPPFSLYHYRVFSNNVFGNYFYVWHRVRFSYDIGYAKNYPFDKVFYYTATSLAETNNTTLLIKDFNHDGYPDFRIKAHPGQSDNLNSNENLPGYSAYEYYLYNITIGTFVLSKELSEAYHVSIDSVSHKITARYYREIPLENGYIYEASYELPDMKLISSFKIERTGAGEINKIPVEVSECYPPISLISSEVQQPLLYIAQYDMPEITTNKKHYFSVDSVYLLANIAIDQRDISKLTFILEEKNNEDAKWHSIQNPYLDDKYKLSTTYGYKIKAGDVINRLELPFEERWLGVLEVGTYRIRVLENEKEVAKTEEFYVHD